MEEGEEVDIGNTGTLVLVEDNSAAAQQNTEEPAFMKYIKNMNINYVNNEYLKEHFAEEDEIEENKKAQ